MIPYGRQSIDQADIDAVVEVLNSDFLTQGPAVPKFEKTVADYCGADHAVAVNSATSALHIACLALGLGPGDILWTSPVTFVASANCALYCGASADFVDIDPRTGNMSVEALARKLSVAERSGRLPKILVPVHFAGQSCDMDAIHSLGHIYGFKVIEDASHGIGGKYQGQPIGNCRYSDITVFSFHPVKIITTGEGGMAMTNDAGLARKMSCLRSHGITRDPSEMTHDPDGPWYYEQVDLGFNYRLTDFQAALGTRQMDKLDEFVRRRNNLATRYTESLASLPVTPLLTGPGCYSSMHLYVIRLHLNKIKRTRRMVFESLRELGVGVNLHYIPVHLQPHYRNRGFNPDMFPDAEKYYQDCITLPLFPAMLDDDIAQIRAALVESIGR